MADVVLRCVQNTPTSSAVWSMQPHNCLLWHKQLKGSWNQWQCHTDVHTGKGLEDSLLVQQLRKLCEPSLVVLVLPPRSIDPPNVWRQVSSWKLLDVLQATATVLHSYSNESVYSERVISCSCMWCSINGIGNSGSTANVKYLEFTRGWSREMKADVAKVAHKRRSTKFSVN